MQTITEVIATSLDLDPSSSTDEIQEALEEAGPDAALDVLKDVLAFYASGGGAATSRKASGR